MIDETIALELWNRRHRKISNQWEKPEIPKEWVEVGERGNQRSWAILQADELVGRVTLRNIEGSSADLGIYLKPGYYGKGIGSRAIQLVQKDWYELRLVVFYRNLRALTCYIRCNFRVSGIEGNWVKMRWRRFI